jgi:hypothetical protein
MNKWNELHSKSEKLASQAELLIIKGNLDQGYELFAKAAKAETDALEHINLEKKRTLGICYVSASALWYKANNLVQSEQIAFKGLTLGIPEFAIEQLRNLLQTIWSERLTEKAKISLAEDKILISVKGGEVVEGGAPLDLIVEKVQVIQKLFYRTVELITGIPHRDHGGPSSNTMDLCRAWLFQTQTGSYQFAVVIEESNQKELFATTRPNAREITTKFFEIINASIEDPSENLEKIIEDKKYRSTFLKLIRNLTPSGKTYDEMEINSKKLGKPIKLVPSVRKVISDSLKEHKEINQVVEEETIKGILRAVDLDRDWLELTRELEHFKVYKVGDTVDDLIGPMMNRQVVVQARKDNKGNYIFIDIESAE